MLSVDCRQLLLGLGIGNLFAAALLLQSLTEEGAIRISGLESSVGKPFQRADATWMCSAGHVGSVSHISDGRARDLQDRRCVTF